jgi:hypothetical protein
MRMETATIIPAPGKLKEVLRKLNELAGGHADATTNGAYEIIVPEWLADRYNSDTVEIKPVRRKRTTKKEVEAEQ